MTIEAGGIGPLPADGAPPADADLLTVRTYRHTGCGDTDRVVVRLVPGTLGEAEDLTMSFLGFGAPESAVPAGAVARQALGFPAWALVHDPANGRHALAMVKQMRKLAKQAGTKPSFAMEEYRGLAGTLGSAAPQFLPTFWEEAGRAFLAGENVRFAATCFNLAREAEQVHALEVDEDRVADVFLEYALAGALPVKAISQYARDLAARGKPDEAFERFRTVTLRRVAGGLAPYPALPAEIKRLAAAAGLAGEAAVDDLIADLLGLAATARCAPGTWKALRPAILRAAKRRPQVRGRLLAMLPEPPGYDSDLTDEWIDLLVATGADAGLVDPAVEPAAASPDGPAGWLERVARQRRRNYRTARSAALLSLVERMLPAVRAAGRPVVLGDDDADLDLIDLCLAGEVDVAWAGTPDPDVRAWINDDSPGRRDLAALAADERFTGALADSTVQAVDRSADLPTVLATPGLRTALTGWLETLPGTAPADPTVLGLEEFTAQIDWVTTIESATVNRDALHRIAGLDVAAGLARTLRTGLLAEFTWPALEQAREDVPADAKHGGSWPNLVLYTRKKAVVVGPDGVVLTHRVTKEGQGWWPDAAWVPGVERLLVFSYSRAYWADAPGDVLELSCTGLEDARGLALPDGTATYGAGVWRPGDPTIPCRGWVISDGERFWALNEESGTARWRPYDPSAGTITGDGDPPAFLAGEGVAAQLCHLVPAPDRFAGSPLGYADGLVGWRVEVRPDGSAVGTRVDGRSVTFPKALIGAHSPTAGLVFPGTDVLCPVTSDGSGPAQDDVTVHTPDGAQPLVTATPNRDLPPTDWWHAWQPRDEAGSAALRGIGTDAVRALLDAAVTAVEAANAAKRAARKAAKDAATTDEEKKARSKATKAAAVAAVTASLPALTDARLRDAVADTVLAAAKLAVRLKAVDALAAAEPAQRGAAATAPAVTLDPQALQTQMRDFDLRTWINENDVTAALAQLAALPDLAAGTATAPKWPDTDVDWPALLSLQGPLALRAASPATPEPQRQAIVTLLERLTATGLAEADGTVRVVRIPAEKKAYQVPQVIRTGERTVVVVTRTGWSSYRFTAIDRDPSGAFGPIEGARISRDRRIAWGGRARVEALLARLDADGPAPWRPDAVADLAEATGMSRGTAVMLLAGMPGVQSDQASFLTKEVRALLGVSVAEARSGRDTLASLTAEQRLDLLAAMLPDDPAQLWADGPDVRRVADLWTSVFGRRLTVPDDVLADAKRADAWRLPSTLLDLTTDPDWLQPGHAKEFAEHVADIGTALRWLVYRLPLDSPLRPALVGWFDRAVAQLADPALRIDASYVQPGTPLPPSVSGKKHGEDWVRCVLHPAKLTGPDDPGLAMFEDDRDVAGVRQLIEPALAALMASVRADAGRTGWAQYPATEVPDLVAEVSTRHGLDADAASYYLQLLALGDPTDRNVIRWTGWTAARLKKARAALVATDLVVEAKRERAGRSAFLPGGWLKSPPIEEWKRPAFGLHREGGDGGLVDAPAHTPAALFRAAWQRVLDGDPPRLRELGRTR